MYSNPLTKEERENMINFIKRIFRAKAPNNLENSSDAELIKEYGEAHSYSDWGL